MPATVTILCENTVARPGALVGEHGFACLIEDPRAGRVLFDTGRGTGLVGNARTLGKDLAGLDAIVLSHGHADHSGGLPAALGASGPTLVYLHPEAFGPRCWAGRYETRDNGVPYSRDELEGLGARFAETREFTPLGEGLWLSGEIPRATRFETGDPHLMVPDPAGDGNLRPDPFRDDLSLVLATGHGLVVIVGCAHAGLCNILLHVRRKTGRERIHAVIGGTHLAPAGEEQFRETVRLLDELAVDKVAVAHCTGLPRGAELARELPGRVFFANVGWSADFPAG